MNYKDCVLV